LNDKQIGQITKKNIVENNLDRYVVCLLDEYKDIAPLLSLFVIYYDSFNYGHRMEVVAYKYEKSWEWNYNKYTKLYDPEWLSVNFTIDKTDTL